VCIYAQRDCDTILFHHEGGVDIGDVDSKVSISITYYCKNVMFVIRPLHVRDVPAIFSF
jgi:succinyl-CoA synthetase beta subunit